MKKLTKEQILLLHRELIRETGGIVVFRDVLAAQIQFAERVGGKRIFSATVFFKTTGLPKNIKKQIGHDGSIC